MTPRLGRGYSATSRGDAAAGTWIFREDTSRRRRGCHVDSLRGRRADCSRGRSTASFSSGRLRRGWDVDIPWRGVTPRLGRGYSVARSNAAAGTKQLFRRDRRAPQVPTGKRKALLVGCNYPGKACALRGCVNDCFRMRDFLRREGFPAGAIRILRDDRPSPTPRRRRPRVAAAPRPRRGYSEDGSRRRRGATWIFRGGGSRRHRRG